jgi:hypothetical protein
MSPRNAVSEGDHRFYEWLGRRYPSVTTILGAAPKPWLGRWAAKMVAEYALKALPGLTGTPEEIIADLKGAPWRVRDEAGERGTAVHLAAETGADMADVPENARAAYASYRAWETAYQPTILLRERQVWSPASGYAGSFDLVADVYGVRYLIDLKTAPKIYPEVPLQIAAYRFADFVGADDEEDTEATAILHEVDAGAVLHLRDDGFTFLRVASGLAEFDDFLALKRIYDWERRVSRTPVGEEIVLPQVGVA